MTLDGGFSGTGYHRSPFSGRLYVVNNGFIVGEVPLESESLVPPEQVQTDLHAEVELEFLRRKTGNLSRYKADIDQFHSPELGARLPLRSAADFRVANLLRPRMPRAIDPPRLVQLGNLGCYAYAHVGWRYVLRPAPNELEVLKQVPVPVLVADVPGFLERERSEVVGEMQEAFHLAGRLHPDGGPEGS
jgi:hypothetical protein